MLLSCFLLSLFRLLLLFFCFLISFLFCLLAKPAITAARATVLAPSRIRASWSGVFTFSMRLNRDGHRHPRVAKFDSVRVVADSLLVAFLSSLAIAFLAFSFATLFATPF